uniref:ShKT domain-containing protein n=1 Tax=Globodera rostochiensis TaxID=31243 RepID=A0A914HZZ6_GLORO
MFDTFVVYVRYIPDSVLGIPDSVLGIPDSVLGIPDSVLGIPDSVLGIPDSVLGIPDSVLGIPDSVLGIPAAVYGIFLSVGEGQNVFGFERGGEFTEEELEQKREQLEQMVQAAHSPRREKALAKLGQFHDRLLIDKKRRNEEQMQKENLEGRDVAEAVNRRDDELAVYEEQPTRQKHNDWEERQNDRKNERPAHGHASDGRHPHGHNRGEQRGDEAAAEEQQRDKKVKRNRAHKVQRKIAGDLATNCRAHLHQCLSGFYKRAMQIYCKGTCSQLGNVNKDFGFNCRPLARQGMCANEKWGEIMFKFCHRSCTRLRGRR